MRAGRGRAKLEPGWSDPYWSPALQPAQEAGSEEMRPAPASGSHCWAAEEGGALGQSRVQQRFPGMRGCGAVCFGRHLPSALQASLWAPQQLAPPVSTHCLLPLGVQHAAPTNPWAGRGWEARTPLPAPSHIQGPAGGLMGEHGFWVHLDLKLSSARDKLCDLGQFKPRFLHL